MCVEEGVAFGPSAARQVGDLREPDGDGLPSGAVLTGTLRSLRRSRRCRRSQVSFVNSICTIRGGTHVTHVSDQVVEAEELRGGAASLRARGLQAILEKVRLQSKEKMKGGVDVRPHHVKPGAKSLRLRHDAPSLFSTYPLFLPLRRARNHLWIFIKCLVENPAFDSQTKERSPSEYPSKPLPRKISSGGPSIS